MATLSPNGRINEEVVREEIDRLRRTWRKAESTSADSALEELLGPAALDDIDVFDRAQLSAVIDVCRASFSLSDAGRKLFAASRRKKASSNDADRLRKYLARFGLDWELIRAMR